MATKVWRGDAPAVKQVNTVTPASVTIGNTFTLTINGKTITFTATAATVANVTAGLAAAVAASTIPEFRRVTAADGTTVLTLTSTVAGVPFTQTSSSATGSGSAGHSLSTSTTTASSGPNHWGIAANWSPSGVPVDNDDVVIENSAVDILYDLSQASIALTSLSIPASYTGKIGLPTYNPAGFYEYLTTYLTLESATTVTIGHGDGAGSSRLRLNLGTNAAAAVVVQGTGRPESTALPALLICGSHADNTISITQGNVGLAVESGTTAQFPVVRVGSEGLPASDVSLVCGAGCTLGGTIGQAGGNVVAQTNVATWTKTAGSTSTLRGTATITTISQDGQGVHNWESAGTIGTANFRGEGAVLNCARDLRSRTLTNGTFTGGGYINDPNKTMTRTNPITTDSKSYPKHVLFSAPSSLQVT